MKSAHREVLEHLIALNKKGELIGEFKDIPNEVYHHPDCPGISSSNLTALSQSYEHYEQTLQEAREERKDLGFRDKFFIGNAVHMATLEPDLFEATFGCKPLPPDAKKNTTAGKALYEDWLTTVYEPWEMDNIGKIGIPQDIYIKIMAQRDSLLRHKTFSDLLMTGEKEVTYFWKCRKTGIIKKCRTDLVNHDLKIITDIKTTAYKATASEFKRKVVALCYDRAAAHYIEGLNEIFGAGYRFVWAVVEKEEPHGCRLFQANDALLEVGAQLCEAPIKKLSDYLKGAIGKGYSDEIEMIGLPAYGFDVPSRLGD